MPSVAIVIPVHNEADFLAAAYARLRSELESLDADVSVLLAENGSTDATAAIANQIVDARLTVLNLPHADYGAAMRAGFIASTDSDWVVNFDIDYYSVPFVADVLAKHDTADVVIASKRAPGSDDRRSAVRRAGTFTFNAILRTMFGSNVSDTHGIKAFRGTVLAHLVPATTRDEDLFDTELVLRAERAGYSIVEVPVVVEELREARSSFLRRVPRTLSGLAQLRRTFAQEEKTTKRTGT